jgi:16S rRNA (adenine1518-N6/adenine1519-N6)-dimethyltransferase
VTTSTLSSGQLFKLARAFQTKKKLGQHFLVDADALNRICGALALNEHDSVLEIGPGIGFLTRVLCQSAGQVTAVELDRESVDYLKTLKLAGLSIKHGDFLAYDILSGRFRKGESEGWSEPVKQERFKVVGNVPYQITGLILGHLLGEIAEPAPHLAQIDCIVLTIQKEVAQRMVALPGSEHYARLSLLISYYCKAEIVCYLPAASFYPAPKVDSAVVKLVPLLESPVNCVNHKLLRKVIKAGFAQRRKMLRNALTALSIPQDEINRVFKELRFDPQVRAESLSLPQFAMLTDALPFGASTVPQED